MRMCKRLQKNELTLEFYRKKKQNFIYVANKYIFGSSNSTVICFFFFLCTGSFVSVSLSL